MSFNKNINARYEEGVSADPTKDMSPEDKAKWDDMNEKYQDLLKTATDKVALSWPGMPPYHGNRNPSGLTVHMDSETKNGFSMCGQRSDPKTTTDDYRECTCYYCMLEYKKNRGLHASSNTAINELEKLATYEPGKVGPNKYPPEEGSKTPKAELKDPGSALPGVDYKTMNQPRATKASHTHRASWQAMKPAVDGTNWETLDATTYGDKAYMYANPNGIGFLILPLFSQRGMYTLHMVAPQTKGERFLYAQKNSLGKLFKVATREFVELERASFDETPFDLSPGNMTWRAATTIHPSLRAILMTPMWRAVVNKARAGGV